MRRGVTEEGPAVGSAVQLLSLGAGALRGRGQGTGGGEAEAGGAGSVFGDGAC